MKIDTLKNLILFLERDARPQGVTESYALVEAHLALKEMFDKATAPSIAPDAAHGPVGPLA